MTSITKANFWNRVLSIILILVLVGAFGALAYSIAVPAAREKFTEFYLLGLDGKAKDYPILLQVGQEGKVIVGIINRERQPTVYRIEVRIDGVLDKEVGPPMLEPDAKWEQIISFVPGKAVDRQKVEFLLYRQGRSEVYQSVYLWVNVR